MIRAGFLEAPDGQRARLALIVHRDELVRLRQLLEDIEDVSGLLLPTVGHDLRVILEAVLEEWKEPVR